MSVDPVTASAINGTNFNRYWYGNNNPYRFTDPDGRQSVDDYGRPNECGPTCVLMPVGGGGQRAFVPASMAPEIASARSSGADSLHDYANVTRKDAVDAADTVGNVSGIVSVALKAVPGPQAKAVSAGLAVVSVAAKSVALTLDPTDERKVDMAADVLLGGVGKAAKGTDTAIEGLADGTERARAAMDAVEEVNKARED